MKTIEQRRTEMSQAFAMLKNGGSAVAKVFSETCLDFWLVDKRNVHMLEQFLEQAKRFPRIQAAARKLLPELCGVAITKKGDKLVVTNIPDLSKKAKAKCLATCRELIAMELTSLLNHPRIKVKVDYVFKKETEIGKCKRQIVKLLENGVSINELMSMVEVAWQAQDKAKKDNVVPMAKQA